MDDCIRRLVVKEKFKHLNPKQKLMLSLVREQSATFKDPGYKFIEKYFYTR